MTLAELSREATLIVVGQAVREQARWSDNRKVILTDIELRVEQVVAGEARVGGTVLVTRVGGRMGDVALTVPGAPHLPPGKRALLFLSKGQDGSLRFVGFSQGLMPVEKRDGVDTVAPKQSGAELVRRGDDGKLQETGGALTSEMALSALISQIRGLLRK